MAELKADTRALLKGIGKDARLVVDEVVSGSRQALPPAVSEARDWVRRLSAGGGTNMMPALSAALHHRPRAACSPLAGILPFGCADSATGRQ